MLKLFAHFVRKKVLFIPFITKLTALLWANNSWTFVICHKIEIELQIDLLQYVHYRIMVSWIVRILWQAQICRCQLLSHGTRDFSRNCNRHGNLHQITLNLTLLERNKSRTLCGLIRYCWGNPEKLPIKVRNRKVISPFLLIYI